MNYKRSCTMLAACAVYTASICVADAATHTETRNVPSKNGFVLDYGTVAAGDTLDLTVIPDECYSIKSGKVVSSTPAGNWEGGPTHFFAIIPDDFAGKHAGSFFGELEYDCSSSGDEEGGPLTWNGTAKASVPTLTVTEVPEYLYADATAWVPVRFEVTGVSSDVDIEGGSVDVTFILNGAEQFTVNAKVAPDKGLGAYTPAKTFTAWVDIEKFKSIDIPEDTTDDGVFKVEAAIKDSVAKNWVALKSDPDEDAGAAVKIFGDKNVEVVEIGFGSTDPRNQLHFWKEETGQKNIRSAGGFKWVHKSGGAIGERDITSLFSGTVTERGLSVHSDNQHGFFVNDSVFLTTNVRATLQYSDYDGTIGDHDGAHVYFGSTYGVTFGCSYGVSYAHHKSVKILSGDNTGMDLGTSSAGGTPFVAMGSAVKVTIEGTGLSPQKTDIFHKMTGGITTAFAIKGALSLTGWGTIPQLIVTAVGTYDFSKSIYASDSRRSVLASYRSFQQVIYPGQSAEDNPPVMKDNRNSTMINNGSVNMKDALLTESGFQTDMGLYTVGSTWVHTVVLDIALDSLDDTFSAGRAKVYGKIILLPPSGKTFATPGIVGVSIANGL